MTRDRAVRALRANPWLRVGTRALAVAGVAGAAWLFSNALGTAAYADGSDTGLLHVLDTTPVAGVVSVLDGGGSTVSIKDPAAVLRTDGAIQAPAGAVEPILDGRALAGPTGPADDVVRSVPALVSPTGTPAGAAAWDLLRDTIGGGDSVIRPVAGLLSPVTSVARDAVTPISRVVSPVTKPVANVLDRVYGATVPGAAAGRTRGNGVVGKVKSGPAATLAANFTGSAAPGRVPAADHGRVAHPGHRTPDAGAPMTGLSADPADSRSATGGTGEVQPYRPRTPVPALPGVAGTGGAPASGSGSILDGGSSATAPTTAATGSADSRRAVRAAEVEVRRLIAAAPTFSPD